MVSTKFVAGIVGMVTFVFLIYLFVSFISSPENTVRVIDSPNYLTGSAAINPYETAKIECETYCSETEDYFEYIIFPEEISDSYQCTCLDYEGNEIESVEIIR